MDNIKNAVNESMHASKLHDGWPTCSDDSTINNERIEIISTEDERLKIIGRELADDTGRAVFTSICRNRIISPGEISRTLDISFPLVNWHLNRLLDAGLVKIEKLAMSQKNKPVKYYGPATTILIIGTIYDRREDNNDEEGGTADCGIEYDEKQLAAKRKKTRDAIWARLSRSVIAGIVAFIAGMSVILSLASLLGGIGREAVITAGSKGMELADPDAIPRSAPGSLPTLIPGIPASGFTDIAIAIVGGAIIGIAVFAAMRLMRPKQPARA